MPTRRWSKHRVVSSGCVVIQRFSRFEGAGGAKGSMSALAWAIPTMKTSMVARGKAVRSAVRSGHHEMTKGMRKTRSIGQDIERWWKVNEVQIPGTKDALYRAFLDSLEQKEQNSLIASIRIVIEHIISGIKRCRIVKDLFRNTKEKYDDLVMEIACALHNFRVHCRQS
jgi:DDE superfamily endonuclease